MTNTKFLLLASACLLLSGNSQASEVKNLTFGYSGSPLVKTHTTHIHTPYELKPISSLDNAVKLAAVRSIVDKGNYDSGLTFGSSDIDTKLDPANQCTAEGFPLTECPEHSSPDNSTRCPHDNTYFSSCTCDTSYYDISLGEYEGIEDICGRLATTQSCSDKSGTYYTCSCSSDNLTLCNAENEFVDFPNDQIALGYFCRTGRSQEITYFQKGVCFACDYPLVANERRNGCTCSLEFVECDLGYEAGAESCTENGVTKYNKCKGCPNVGTYTTCPAGYACSFEDCSNKYYITGCATKFTNIEDCSWKCKFMKIMPKN